jgi:hypothetical protein
MADIEDIGGVPEAGIVPRTPRPGSSLPPCVADVAAPGG